jgi:hypothetical protein
MFLEKVGLRSKRIKLKNYFPKSLPYRKECLLLHPLWERSERKKE